MMERHRFDVSEGDLHPASRGVPSDHGRGSIEYGYVVAGAVELACRSRRAALQTGDAVQFSARHPTSTARSDASRILTVVAYADD